MRQLGIIKNVNVGLRDVGSPILWFDTYTEENTAALQIFSWDEAYNIIKRAGVYGLKELEGRPCWLDVDGNKITFESVWKK